MGRTGNYSTEKRAKILEYLKNNNDKDVSVKEIENYLLNDINISVNVTTIYRYLDKLVKDGAILKHTNENGNGTTYQYASLKQQCHSHLHIKCSNCGKIIHMNCDFMDELKSHIYQHHRFILECKTSMLYGLCEACNNVIGG